MRESWKKTERERETDVNPPFFKDDEASVMIESVTTLVTEVPLREINGSPNGRALIFQSASCISLAP